MSAPSSLLSPSQRGFSRAAIYDIATACDMIKGISYKRDWTIESKPSQDFEMGIVLTFIFPAVDSRRQYAPTYDKPLNLPGLPDGFQTASFTIVVDGCSEIELYRKVIDKIIECEIHEAREFFRVGAALDAPFHPHQVSGSIAFGTELTDPTFGVTRG